jgi:hypothetical protein
MKKMFSRAWSSDGETPCGQGSRLVNTADMRPALQALLIKYGIDSIDDCGCGDFNWVKQLNLGGIDYIGYDVVDRRRYDLPFEVKDIIRDELAECALIICKDVFIHWTNEMIQAALSNFRDYTNYLFAETTPGIDNSLRDLSAGGFSRVNLEGLPFNLGTPMEIIQDPTFRRVYGWWDITP